MFTSFASSFLVQLFNSVFQMFQITIPGTTITFWGLGLGLFATFVVLSVLKQFTGLGLSTARSSGRQYGQRGGNNRNIKVNQNRKNDER